MADILIDKAAAALLVDGALQVIWDMDQAGELCCPQCCGPCAALATLRDNGQLDDLMWPRAGDGDARWDQARGQVDRALLDRVWQRTDCHTR